MVEGRGVPPDPFERAIVALARKTVDAPAALVPDDLIPLRDAVGDGAITYTLVAGAFHFVNRIADLLHVDSEALPEGLRRFEMLRKVSVRMAARMFRGVDLANRDYSRSFAAAVADLRLGLRSELSTALELQLAPLRARPHVIEILRYAIAERDERSSLSREMLVRIQRGVETALPSKADDAHGFHARPRDPVDAFVFVGTRYPARTTAAMIEALRANGFDDLGILDLAIAIADANQWARTSRLLGLEPGLFYLPGSTSKPAARENRQRAAGAMES